jgi:hypothetical protein
MKGAVVTAIALAMGASAGNPENTVIRPGVPVFDTQGNRLYAGGANIWFENNTYWLVGEVSVQGCPKMHAACRLKLSLDHELSWSHVHDKHTRLYIGWPRTSEHRLRVQ